MTSALHDGDEIQTLSGAFVCVIFIGNVFTSKPHSLLMNKMLRKMDKIVSEFFGLG